MKSDSRNKHVPAKKEKVSERLRYLQAHSTHQYQISYTEALVVPHELENLTWRSKSVKDLGEGYSLTRSSQFGCH